MAITKTHPIKSALKAAIDYICNPAKTDGSLLVSSYGCSAQTADIEFTWTRRQAIDNVVSLNYRHLQEYNNDIEGSVSVGNDNGQCNLTVALCIEFCKVPQLLGSKKSGQ